MNEDIKNYKSCLACKNSIICTHYKGVMDSLLPLMRSLECNLPMSELCHAIGKACDHFITYPVTSITEWEDLHEYQRMIYKTLVQRLCENLYVVTASEEQLATGQISTDNMYLILDAPEFIDDAARMTFDITKELRNA